MPFTGAVVTLLPRADEAERLVLEGGDPADALHVTLAWLGDTEDPELAPELEHADAVAAVRDALEGQGTIAADAFAVATFNPPGFDDTRDPATVLLVQSHDLASLRERVQAAVPDRSDFPVWFPHLTLGYELPALGAEELAARVGEVVFDRVSVAWGDQVEELTLDGEEPVVASVEEDTMPRVIVRTGRATETEPRASFEVVQPDELALDRDVADVEAGSSWEGVLAIEDELTGDGRMFEPGALRWEALPIPLRWVREDSGEHQGAVVVGRIDEIWRDGNKIMGRGVFDQGSEDGQEARRQVAEGLTPGVSVDLDDVDFEIRVDREAFEEGIPEEGEPDVDEDGRELVVGIQADEEVMVTTDARVRAATIVATPAFADARIALAAGEGDEATSTQEDDAAATAGDEEPLAASLVAAASRPPAEWFENPGLGAPTGLTVSDDGRVFGHLATWGTCHTGYAGECVQPPSSDSGYAYFRTGAVKTAEGDDVPVGRLTLDTTHAGRRLGATDTAAHYEHTGVAVADVAAGEDEHGIWVAGVLRPGVSDEQAHALQASPLSGDWRRIGGRLELVAALAVNSPGFPVPRVLVAGGQVRALQSSGVVATRRQVRASGVLTGDDQKLLNRMLRREREAERARREQADAARRRVLVASAASKMAATRR